MQNLKIIVSVFTILLALSILNITADAITYKYDRLGRLIEATYDTGQTVIYTYDAGGNITSVIGEGDDIGTPTLTISAITGVTAPVAGAVPISSITETDQFTGTVTWSPTVSNGTFANSTVYTAIISIKPKTGYTLTGITANFFTVAGATTVSNAANSGVVTAVFPSTATESGLSASINLRQESGDIRATYSVANTSGSNRTIIFVLAKYNDEGRLIEFTTDTQTISSGNNATKDLILSAASGYIAKSFIWGGGTYVPLAESSQIRLTP